MTTFPLHLIFTLISSSFVLCANIEPLITDTQSVQSQQINPEERTGKVLLPRLVVNENDLCSCGCYPFGCCSAIFCTFGYPCCIKCETNPDYNFGTSQLQFFEEPVIIDLNDFHRTSPRQARPRLNPRQYSEYVRKHDDCCSCVCFPCCGCSGQYHSAGCSYVTCGEIIN